MSTLPTVNVLSPLVSHDGKVVIESETQLPIILRNVACNALCAKLQGETLTGEQKVKRFRLAARIAANDEVATVNGCVDRTYGTLITAAAFGLLDPPPEAQPDGNDAAPGQPRGRGVRGSGSGGDSGAEAYGRIRPRYGS